MFVIIRIIIGLIFCISGFEKLTSPYQNFLYVIQGYDVFPSNIEVIAAKLLPWVELFSGLFLVFGLWIKESSVAAGIMFVSFITIVSQAMIRKLPIEECGCFGGSISFPLYVIVLMDSVFLILTSLLFFNSQKAQKFSLDSTFSSSK